MIRGVVRNLLGRVGLSLTRSLAEQLAAHRRLLVTRTREMEQRLQRTCRDAIASAERQAAKQRQTTEELARQVTRLRAELRLLAARSRPVSDAPPTGGPRIPITAEPPGEDRDRTTGASEIPRDTTLTSDECPVCGSPASTMVCEYNKLLLLRAGVDEESRVYLYALCHDCGVVSARKRPSGARYAYLLQRFEVTLGRAEDGGSRSGNIALRSGGLSERERAMLRDRLARGVFVSEHLGVPRRQYVPALLQDVMAASVHVELLGSLLSLNAARVLELRPRLGSIGASLKRRYAADVSGMPLFESQQFLIREAYGIPVDHRIDYDVFAIPYPGEFDLIVANHMFTHVVRPREFFATVLARLRRGGHLYLYNEPDESDFTRNGKSMFNTLNAFHLQTFDGPSLTRALRLSGFEPVFVTHHRGNLIALARAGSTGEGWPRMSTDERVRRLAAYRKARDLAILRLPDPLRGRFASEWDEVVERSFAAGLIDFDAAGHLRFVKTAESEVARSRG